MSIGKAVKRKCIQYAYPSYSSFTSKLICLSLVVAEGNLRACHELNLALLQELLNIDFWIDS